MKKRMIAALLCMLLAFSLLSASAFAADDTEICTIGEITLHAADGTELQAIPAGSGYATVPVTCKETKKNISVLVACYTNQGKFAGYAQKTIENASANVTVRVNVPINNASGSIAFLKAFVTASVFDMTPLGKAVKFGTASDNPDPGEHELPIHII